MAVMEVLWHEKAEKQVEDALNYCFEHYGRSVARNLANAIDRDVLLLSENPYLGKVEESLHRSVCYRSLIEGPSKLIYTIEDGYIFIHLFWDCRRQPESINLYLD